MSDILSPLEKNSQGEYKGGGEAIDGILLDTGDVYLIKLYVKRAATPAQEDLIGAVESPPVDAPDAGKKWFWRSRDWLEQKADPNP